MYLLKLFNLPYPTLLTHCHGLNCVPAPTPSPQFRCRRLNLWYFWMWLYLETGLLRGCCSVTQSCRTLWDPMDWSTPGFLYFTQTLLKLKSIELMMLSNHLILCHPLFLLPSIFLSIRVFFLRNCLFASGGQSFGASASASILPMNLQDWFPLRLTGFIL